MKTLPKLPKVMSWNRDEARAGKFDGRFILGVLSTGIYCLPSCAARPPRPENARVFATEVEAQAAGLRACKRCRPDLYYRGTDEGTGLFEGLAARVTADTAQFADASALAREAGVSATRLGELFRAHAHLAPAQWLRRMRVQQAARELLTGRDKVAEIGFGAGFESESVFHHQFLAHTRMTPGAWRALDGATTFLLHLPGGYRAQEILGYHARDPEGLTERSEGNRIWKALATVDGPAVLEIEIGKDGAWVKIHANKKLGRDAMAFLHEAALRMLGLNNEVSQFETRHAAFAARRRGLRLPNLPTGFDALAWGIIGQQITVKLAGGLRRDLIQLAGEKIGDMRTHPTAEAVANLSVAELHSRRYSRSKAQYLIDAAATIARGDLQIESLHRGSAVAAEKTLLAQRGIGLWTARYILMRVGFADAPLIGDAALVAALQKLHKLDERPGPEETARLMQPFAPHRSLATMHLWTYLKEAA
jgi:AraC family transcriptional regulator of adaptative response / DNA-3-methyladenine glycosylase II